MYENQAKYPEALQMHKEVLDICLKIFGPDHLSVAVFYGNIGNVCESQAKYLEAPEMHQKCLKIEEKIHRPEHLDMARTQENIANVLYRGDFLRAAGCGIGAGGPNNKHLPICVVSPAFLPQNPA